ncbi:cyclase family protein [Pyrococcus yayanosii]|uniref:Cyclase-related protein n=1 Tax=Pyrococcus yayanosii (strain CH1 / JCM 16557) TaxID=529709 RepID=F8AI33_PYRYC|nr:cyclase family protein [Pyrococcus yayanosii]AEH25501.1 cyclase-related protein [Pyrococcus yayanosii CH1]
MIIDLSMPLGKNTPVYPGDPPVEVMAWASIERNGYYMNALRLGEHSGTHVDAPVHFVPRGPTIEEIPLERFIGKGIVIDVRMGKGRVEPGELPSAGLEGVIVLLLTGGRELSPEAAEKLVALGVKAVGTDGISIGDEDVHRILLGAGIPVFENLINLELLLGKEFTFIGLPLRIEKGSGSPVRAVAVVGAPAGI